MAEETALRTLESSSALAAIERERFHSYSQLVRNLHWLAAALVRARPRQGLGRPASPKSRGLVAGQFPPASVWAKGVQRTGRGSPCLAQTEAGGDWAATPGPRRFQPPAAA